MKNNILNPFLVSGYHSPKYFCDREEEAEKIISALNNDRNLSLISPRRIGKTGLIHHVFHLLREKDRNIRCFYIDIFPTQSLSDFVSLFAKTVLGELDSPIESSIKKVFSFFKSLRPSLTYDQITGEPRISFELEPNKEEAGLKEIFEYLEASGRKCYIAIDEFQQITEYPEKGVEALLRSYIQFLTNVKFVFSGSKKHIMDVIFSSANRPFYQSTQKIGLRVIDRERYYEFAQEHFNQASKSIDKEAFDYIYDELLGHTWYVQSILNHLYSKDKTNYDLEDVNHIINSIIEEEDTTYKTYCEMITKGQLKLLVAIAKERNISSPYESEFINKYELSAPSSVRSALNSLIDKTLVLKEDDGNHIVYDRFFSIWLRRKAI